MSIVRRTPPTDPGDKPAWSEHKIASALALQTFQRKAVVITPNCNWTGYECDLLVVEQRLRIIDVEIKISRADLKADAKKDKWWQRQFAGYEPEQRTYSKDGRLQTIHRKAIYNSTAREWPVKVWKHYYALPADIWDDSLIDCLPSPHSGVIALHWMHSENIRAEVVRRATPNKQATVLTPAQAVNIARLTNLRYWDVRRDLDAMRRQAAG